MSFFLFITEDSDVAMKSIAYIFIPKMEGKLN